MGPLRKTSLLLLAAALAALIVSGCGGFYKPGSLQVTQPTGLGTSVRVHFNTCTFGEESVGMETKIVPCGPTKPEPGEAPVELQQLLAFAIPAGVTAPATVTEVGIAGAPNIVLTRNDQVGAAFATYKPKPEKALAPWPPPAGSQVVGYASGTLEERLTDHLEWTVDPQFAIPAGSPFAVTVGTGLRFVSEKPEYSASRGFDCAGETEEEFLKNATFCEIGEARTIGTSALTIAAPAGTTAFLGGTAKLAFPFEALTSASPAPTFALTAATNLPGATATLAAPTYVPTGVDATTHRSAPASGTVDVSVPATAAPGTYTVTLTATAPGGGAVSQTGSIVVAKAKLKFGKVKLNKAKGTATVTVTVPSAGTLTVKGKTVVKAQKQAAAPKTLKVLVKAKGKATKKLAATGKAKVSAKFGFKPASGSAVTQTKKLTLKLK